MSSTQNSTEQLQRYQAKKENLQANINKWNLELDEKLARNAQLQEKVDQLKIAQTHMKEALKKLNELGSMMQGVSPGEWWGANWDTFSFDMREGATLSAYTNAYSHATKTIEEIDHEIYVLSSQVDILAEAIGGLRSFIRDGNAQIKTISTYMSALPR